MTGHVVIVGAGHGGGALATLLRAQGHDGPITLIGSEPALPYQRPPLSKAWLSGEADADSLLLRLEEHYAEDRIGLRLGTTVGAIYPATHQVRTCDGQMIGYDQLVLATGAGARALQIPGADLPFVASLRDMADAFRLKTLLLPGRTLGVIGGGYIGLEVAASARKLGLDVVVIEREPRLLARVACKPLSDFFLALHQAHGVQFHFSAAVGAITADGAGRGLVQLTGGAAIRCDAVLVGVGAVPRDEIARAAGIVCDNGIVVDAEGRTSHPGIFALGDVAMRPLPLYGRMARLESVPSALEIGRQICAAILGKPAPAPEVPWFWSDQYDVKLQIAGVAFDADTVLLRGAPPADFVRRPGGFAVFHLRAGRPVAVEAINAPGDFMAGRKLILAGRPVDAQRLADPAVTLKELLR